MCTAFSNALLALKADGGTFGFGTNKFYQDNYGMPVIFNHHDMTMQADRDYVGRCVDRMRASLISPKHKFFFLVAPAHQISEHHFSCLHHVLEQRSKNFSLLVFASRQTAKFGFVKPKATVVLDYESGLLVNLMVSSQLGPVCYPNLNDQLVMIDTFIQAVEYMVLKRLRQTEAQISAPVENREVAL